MANEFDEDQFERDLEHRGRSRSRSFIVDDDDDNNGASHEDVDVTVPRERGRSQSFCSENGDDDDDNGNQSDKIAKAASLSKVYMKGSQPIDPNNLPPPKSGRKRNTKQQTGALSDKALNTLSEGLHNSARINKQNLSEEEMEELKMAKEEAENLKKEKEVKKPSASKRAFAFASKAKSSILNRALGNRLSSSKDEGSNSTAGSFTSHSSLSSFSGRKSNLSEPGKERKRQKLKLLLLGDSGVGKTSLLRVISGDKFSESMLATAGVDFKIRNIAIENYDVQLQVWDTAGQERFHRITATYYKGADGIILVYDVNDRNGFDNVGYWMNNIQQYSGNKLPAMLLVGNKIDLPNRAVSQDEGKSTSSQYHCRFLETSAKTSENVEDAVVTIATDALFLALNEGMSQKELLEKEKKYGRGGLHKENCVIS